MKRFLTLAAMAALSLGAAACGGDDDDDGGTGPNEGGNLSAAEVEDVFDALSAIGFSFGAEPMELPAGLALQSESFDETEPCPNGGNVRIAGTVGFNQSNNSSTADIRQTYNNCQSASSTGRVWTFNGDPNLRIQMTSSFNQASGAYSLNATMTGGFRYASNGKSGSCSANINITSNANGGSVSGTMCGESVNESFDGN